MGLKVGVVELVNYNCKWKENFATEAEHLKDMFGDIAKAIEHIGSTAIPGLSAKPIIDIAVAVNKLSDFDTLKDKFNKTGNYYIKEDSTPGEILIRKGEEENRTHYIHVMELDSDRYKDSILFRDYLLNHDEAKESYETLKKDLALKYSNDRKMYTASKNEFITNILKVAKVDNN